MLQYSPLFEHADRFFSQSRMVTNSMTCAAQVDIIATVGIETAPSPVHLAHTVQIVQPVDSGHSHAPVEPRKPESVARPQKLELGYNFAIKTSVFPV